MRFPNLKNVKLIAEDIETKEHDIKRLGSGARRPDTCILGVSIATNDKEWYFPFNHPDSENVDIEKFIAWRKQYLHIPVVGANYLYDLDYLQYKNLVPTGKIFDIQFAEPLLDEYKLSYSLNTLSEQYLGIKKQEEEIEELCKKMKWKGAPQAHLYKMKSDIVGKYAKADARQTYDIFLKQLPILEKEELKELFEMECALIPLLLKMKRQGVRINEEELDKKEKLYQRKINKFQKELNNYCGFPVNVNAHESLRKAFDKFKIVYPFTEKDNPSFGATFLENNDSHLAELVLELKGLKKIHSTYLKGMKEFVINGRIHADFNPLRSDTYGTVSGRFSSTHPNLQNIPSRNEEYKKDIRSLFLPEENCQWVKLDFKQEEMAIFAHYAMGESGAMLRKMYIEDEKADIYKIMAQIGYGKNEISDDERRTFKTVSLGVLYGMGTDKLGRKLKIITEDQPGSISVSKTLWEEIKNKRTTNRDCYKVELYEIYWNNVYKRKNELADIPKECVKYLKQYRAAWQVLHDMHEQLPCMKETTKRCEQRAQERGYVKTILGRKRRFTKDFYKSFNAVDQGSGGDIMKKAMLDSYNAGIFDSLPLHLTVHDELDVSCPETKEGKEALKELKHTMETCVQLKVPLRTDCEIGENWGHLERTTI